VRKGGSESGQVGGGESEVGRNPGGRREDKRLGARLGVKRGPKT